MTWESLIVIGISCVLAAATRCLALRARARARDAWGRVRDLAEELEGWEGCPAGRPGRSPSPGRRDDP